ncbi:hypothetical protein GCM10029963_69330 [Micromonospora andamanensis]|uniref:Uncharacterized protein n=1 Tax=Micromonospora andamanensis TaxID=1287068 RepID=A0ABQ4I3E2_9ACTN|nr:hypothetical protein Van01_56360 [Micromonospora andamanensis]GIJ38911.1 hypothetical protein Vwe01_22360 [Micromonospora andamanensis]
MPVATADPSLQVVDRRRLVAGRLKITYDLETAIEPGYVERHAVNGTPGLRQPIRFRPLPAAYRESGHGGGPAAHPTAAPADYVQHVIGFDIRIVWFFSPRYAFPVGRSRRPTGPVAGRTGHAAPGTEGRSTRHAWRAHRTWSRRER